VHNTFHFALPLRAAVCILIALGPATGCLGRERGPRVEVVCPSPPIPVRVDKRQVVVYELNVTNFDLVPLRLKRMAVFADEAGGAPLSALDGDALAKAMTRIGLGASGSTDTAGNRAWRSLSRFCVDRGGLRSATACQLEA
jgi:hypothetical protein